MGITRGILEAAFEAAEERGATRIAEIRIRVGELTEIVEFALQFAFESLTPGTLAEGAKLAVEHVGARSRCGRCGTEFDHGRFDALCPECGNPFNEPVAGRELLITSIDIETPEGLADALEDPGPAAGAVAAGEE